MISFTCPTRFLPLTSTCTRCLSNVDIRYLFYKVLTIELFTCSTRFLPLNYLFVLQGSYHIELFTCSTRFLPLTSTCTRFLLLILCTCSTRFLPLNYLLVLQGFLPLTSTCTRFLPLILCTCFGHKVLTIDIYLYKVLTIELSTCPTRFLTLNYLLVLQGSYH